MPVVKPIKSGLKEAYLMMNFCDRQSNQIKLDFASVSYLSNS